MAELSDFTKFKTGCVVVYKNRVISSSCNLQKSHPLQDQYNIYRKDKISDHRALHNWVHAEIHALSYIYGDDIQWSKVGIYVYRITKAGYGLAKPCPSCMQLIRDLGIKNVFYTTNDGYNHLLLK